MDENLDVGANVGLGLTKAVLVYHRVVCKCRSATEA
jgi:hypothetical protein